MAKYTVSLYELACSRSMGTGTMDYKIEKLREYLFDFDYPIYNNEHKEIFEKKFIKHYLMYEIGLETPYLFKVFLENRLYEIMPFFNQLYKLQEIFDSINLLEDRNMYHKNLTDENIDEDSKRKNDEGYQENEGEEISDTFNRNEDENGTRNQIENETFENEKDIRESGIININGNENSNTTETLNHQETEEDSINKWSNLENNEESHNNKTLSSSDEEDSTENKNGNSTQITDGNNKTTHKLDETTQEQNNTGNSDYPQGNVAANKDYYSSAQLYKGQQKNIGNNIDTEEIDTTITNTNSETDISNIVKSGSSTESQDTTKDFNSSQKEGENTQKENNANENKTINTDNEKQEKTDETKNIDENNSGNTKKNLGENYENEKNSIEKNNNQRQREMEYNKLLQEANKLIRNLDRTEKGREHGLTGNRTVSEMINEYRQNYFDTDILLIQELSDLFMNIY